MAAPTVAWVKDTSLVDFGTLGYTNDAQLQRLLDVAVRSVKRYTGQGWLADTTFSYVAPMGVDDEPLVLDAVLSFTEWLAYRKQPDVTETLGDFDLILNFSAGSYSEGRRTGKDSLDAHRAFLKALFWPLMSDDLKDEWIEEETGIPRPSFEVTEVDWSFNEGASYGPEGPAGADSVPYPTYERTRPW